MIDELNQMIEAFDEVAFERYKGIEGVISLNENEFIGWGKLKKGWHLYYENHKGKEPLRRAPVNVRVEAGVQLPELIKVLDAHRTVNEKRTRAAIENLREAVYALRVK